MAWRFGGPGQPYDGLVFYKRDGRTPGWTGEARFIPEMLDAPLRWRKPSLVFVNSMSDLFHDDITNEQIAAAFGIMAACPQHTFQILSKRPQRMVEWFAWIVEQGGMVPVLTGETPPDGASCEAAACAMVANIHGHSVVPASQFVRAVHQPWPLPNVHLGVSVENQAAADERIPLLLQCPAAVRWVSCEPLLSALNLDDLWGERRVYRGDTVSGFLDWEPSIDWIVCGGESGPNARPLHPDWARSLRNQCHDAGVPFWFKQWGELAPERLGHGMDLGGEMRRGAVQILHAEGNPEGHFRKGDVFMRRAGKKLAGNLLDGVRYEMRPGDKW